MKSNLSQYELLDLAHQYSKEYLEDNKTANVFPDETALHGLNVFDEPFPVLGTEAVKMLSMLNTFGAPATVRYGSGRYFGFVNGGVFPSALAARWVADTWGQNGALHLMSPVVSKLEMVCEKWLVNIFKLPEETACGYVSGTSSASIVALTAARDFLLNKKGWDANSNGLFGAPELKVIISNNAHSSIYKALSIVGFGRDRVIKVPTDSQGRMIIEKIPPLDDSSLVICQAGEVNTGAFDFFEEICELAKKSNAWVHVDGAFGLWAAASQQTYHLYKGAEQADSWAADAHKTLNAPYDTGIVLCRHRSALINSMRSSGAYLEFADARDGMFFTPEMSRRARVIDIWSVLKTLGSQGLEELIDKLCWNAKTLSSMLWNNGFTILNEASFNQVLFACDTSEETKELLARAQRSGQIWCGGTVWNNKLAIRMSVCDWATTQEDIICAVDVLVKSLKSIRKQYSYV
jgi:glutamate/tyrosine decarboxylase-like PLP-dependent enzyme